MSNAYGLAVVLFLLLCVLPGIFLFGLFMKQKKAKKFDREMIPSFVGLLVVFFFGSIMSSVVVQ